MLVDYSSLFASYDQIEMDKRRQTMEHSVPRNALQSFLHSTSEARAGTGFQRMKKCRLPSARNQSNTFLTYF